MFFLRVSFQYMYFVPNIAANNAFLAKLRWTSMQNTCSYVFYPTLLFHVSSNLITVPSNLNYYPAPAHLSPMIPRYPPPPFHFALPRQNRDELLLGNCICSLSESNACQKEEKKCRVRMNICFQFFPNCWHKFVEVLDSYFYIP